MYFSFLRYKCFISVACPYVQHGLVRRAASPLHTCSGGGIWPRVVLSFSLWPEITSTSMLRVTNSVQKCECWVGMPPAAESHALRLGPAWELCCQQYCTVAGDEPTHCSVLIASPFNCIPRPRPRRRCRWIHISAEMSTLAARASCGSLDCCSDWPASARRLSEDKV